MLALLLTIALGVGSNVSVYGFILGLTKSGLPLASVNRVVSIFAQDTHKESGALTRDEYLRVEGCCKVFEWVGAARVTPGLLKIGQQSPIVSIASLTPPLADALGFSEGPGVVIGHQIWENEFDPARQEPVLINGVSARVGGIAPAKLEGLYRDRAIDVWMPVKEKDLPQLGDGNRRNFWVVARLRRGVSIAEAQAALRDASNGSDGFQVTRYTGATPETEEGISRVGNLLRFAAGAVFLIACANVISFLLARAFAGSHETSLRVALGASRVQLARELLWDSIVISVAGGVCGLLLALWTLRVIPGLLFQEDADRLVFLLPASSVVVICTICVSITTLCGLLPVLVTSDRHPASVLRREGVGPSKTMRRVRMGLVVGQMASCCVLVSSAAVLLTGFHAALQTSVGRHLGDPLLVTVQAQAENDITYFREVERAARSMADVLPMAWAGRLPGGAATWQLFRIEPPDLAIREIKVDVDWFTADSFKLFKMPPSEGGLSGFRNSGCRVAILNEEAAAKLLGKQTVGRIIQDATGLATEIIGVVAEKQPHPGRGPTVFYNHIAQGGPAPERIALAQFHAPIPSELAETELDVNVVSPSYFNVMGLTLIAGRDFAGRPEPGECRVAVSNREAADLYFGGKAIGSAVIDYEGIRTTVIGVVKSKALGPFQRHAEPAIYLPMSQDCPVRMTLIASARNPTNRMLLDLRQTIASVPGHGWAPVVIKTLSAQLSQTALSPLRIAAVIVSASASTALALSLLGLYSALSDAARQRRRELAIRIALGAARWRVIGQVLSEGGRLAGAGILLGTMGSLALLKFLGKVVLTNTTPEWWVWLAAPIALAVSVAIASILPARHGLIISPLAIMREDN